MLFELMVDQGHLDQRIRLEERVVVDEPLEIRHERDDVRGILRRRVDDSSRGVLERGTRHLPEAGAVALECFLYVLNVFRGQEPGGRDGLEAGAECLSVAEDFLRTAADGFLWKGRVAEQLVVGRDDVLDLGTVLGLLKAEGIDEDLLIRNRCRNPFQFSELPACCRQSLQDGRRLEPLGVDAG